MVSIQERKENLIKTISLRLSDGCNFGDCTLLAVILLVYTFSFSSVPFSSDFTLKIKVFLSLWKRKIINSDGYHVSRCFRQQNDIGNVYIEC